MNTIPVLSLDIINDYLPKNFELTKFSSTENLQTLRKQITDLENDLTRVVRFQDYYELTNTINSNSKYYEEMYNNNCTIVISELIENLCKYYPSEDVISFVNENYNNIINYHLTEFDKSTTMECLINNYNINANFVQPIYFLNSVTQNAVILYELSKHFHIENKQDILDMLNNRKYDYNYSVCLYSNSPLSNLLKDDFKLNTEVKLCLVKYKNENYNKLITIDLIRNTNVSALEVVAISGDEYTHSVVFDRQIISVI